MLTSILMIKSMIISQKRPRIIINESTDYNMEDDMMVNITEDTIDDTKDNMKDNTADDMMDRVNYTE
jgi:hypothetical protein